MDARRPLAAAALAAAATGFALEPPPAGPADRSAARLAGPEIASADLRVSAGRSATILRVPSVGRWSATCSPDHRVAIAFVADRLLPTSDVVVARTAGAPLGRRVDPGDAVRPDPPLEVVSERWQIAPFASAQVRVTSADVAGRGVHESGSRWSCAASVVAVTGPDQGATRER
jgi:hypothetical protein